jgi:hypothetical protein
LDAKWYKNNPDKEGVNLSMIAWNNTQSLPQVFEANDKWNIVRADKIGDEFGVQYIIKSNGNEYQRIDEMKSTKATFILPLNFPQAMDLEDPTDARFVNVADLKHWELAPTNLGAFEKAGIIKPNVPVIIGEHHPDTLNVFHERALKNNATIHYAFEEFELEETNNYKAINERTVKCTVKKLNTLGFTISKQHFKNGIDNLIKNRNFIGRFQIIEQNPLTILDVSHNEAGLKSTFELLKKVQHGKLHILFGASSDKNLEDILLLFPKDALYYFTVFSSNRSCTKKELIHKSRNTHLNILFFDSLEETLIYTKTIVNKEDTLLITGSFFLISDFIELFSLNHL